MNPHTHTHTQLIEQPARRSPIPTVFTASPRSSRRPAALFSRPQVSNLLCSQTSSLPLKPSPPHFQTAERRSCRKQDLCFEFGKLNVTSFQSAPLTFSLSVQKGVSAFSSKNTSALSRRRSPVLVHYSPPPSPLFTSSFYTLGIIGCRYTVISTRCF